MECLQSVRDDATGKDVVSAGLVSGVVVRGGEVGFLLTIDPAEKDAMEPLRAACEQAVAAMDGVEKVTAVLTADAPAAAEAPKSQPAQAAQWNRQPVDGVKHILAVASGKGGVGKSTTSVCLAYALAAKGLKVGILDADIYGPSIPTMMGLSGQPDIEGQKMIPARREGIACMSMGFLVGDDAAILRGPMVTKALNQMLRATHWGDLDVLVVDMPPGTGDVHLSMAQSVPISGAVVVTTPQRVATVDAKKAIQMFRKTGVPVMGVVENMSYLQDPATGHMAHPFGKGGGDKLAKEMSTLFLGEIPLEPGLGAAVDEGALTAAPEAFNPIADSVWNQLDMKVKAAAATI
ncbi:MAG: P-loop NTPase [Rickettsiales bacterium]